MDDRLEQAIVRATGWTGAGVVAAGAGLLVPQPDDVGRLGFVVAHLAALVAFGMLVTLDLVSLPTQNWFPAIGDPGRRWLAGAAAKVALVTGTTAVVTLASSAFLRLAPSLQYLQLLSAMDIAWVVAAVALGVSSLAGVRRGLAAGSAVGVACVWSIWRYLEAVGFAEDGGWLVDGTALFRYVIPFDVAAAVVAVATLLAASLRVRRVSRESAGV